ncbi:MAG: hypothetical protein J2P41_10150 [Blastocatellia bacterium]|nr:hypothetical protein [Blastocatellia bacterium]
MTNEESTGQAIIPTPVSMGRTTAACVAALVLPGLGHVLLGKWGRGIILGLAIIAMFVLGFAMDGHLYKPESGEWLTWFFSFLNSGMGAPYLVCLLADWGIQVQPEQAARVTFEYGNTFLCVAGALNMLATIDAYDIGVGRKA